jgi:hypothetical protein
MNVVSFSVFGSDPKYCVGAIKNIDLAEKYYPDWTCLIWHDKTVPNEYLREIEKRKNVQLINASELKMPGRYWRFNCFQLKDIQTFCVRDTDSRLSQREVDAVEQWIQSEKSLHIMRDHPHHNFPVMAGMWAFRNDLATWDIEKFLVSWLQSHKIVDKIDDTNFLTLLYRDFVNSTLVHDDWFRCQNSVKFPNDRLGKRFIGEIFDENDTPDIHWTLL